jgi:hypothetical protein
MQPQNCFILPTMYYVQVCTTPKCRLGDGLWLSPFLFFPSGIWLIWLLFVSLPELYEVIIQHFIKKNSNFLSFSLVVQEKPLSLHQPKLIN